ncbi:uncharacterized protein G2W53_023792 [Senna tora]|uniref:Uncharacterized protein n=1 Tax=Senna tora TaxID=362788 RepID=A0A834TAL8_9FABA|nr:uncharacterized protein G2W53_023792 [Senna tora]
MESVDHTTPHFKGGCWRNLSGGFLSPEI